MKICGPARIPCASRAAFRRVSFGFWLALAVGIVPAALATPDPLGGESASENVSTGGYLSSVLTPAARADDGDDDPALDQTLDPNQEHGDGRVLLEKGHIDIGGTLGRGGDFLIEAHDDTGDHSVWRRLSDVVIRVNDEAKVTVPDDDTYSFIGAEPGQDVWIIPQTQNPDVVWLGWNTQEPQLMDTVSGGVTFSVTGIEGPGTVNVYLQSGNFGAPEVLWTSEESYPQKAWIGINSHTHANWSFTQPGIYLLHYELSAVTLSGEDISTQDTLRIAVGTSTDVEEAFGSESGQSDGSDTAADSASGAESRQSQSAAATGEQGSETASPMKIVLVAGVVIVAVALIGSILAFVISGRRARKRVWEARLDRGSDQPIDQWPLTGDDATRYHEKGPHDE